VAKLVHVGLDGIRKVDEKVRSPAITTTSRIQANCGNHWHGPPLDEVLVIRKRIQPLARIYEVLSKAKLGADLVYLVFGLEKPQFF
jgi:hypothetical protein